MEHTLGSHSDDRGGADEAPCHCDAKTERVIRIHFVGRDTLQLHGEHVPNFLKAYYKAIVVGDSHFVSEAKDKVLIQIDTVTFIEETTITEKLDD